jgi:serine/threonine protein kinase
LVLNDNYCEKCGKEYTDLEYKWCKQCQINYLKSNFANWTSGNEKIDDLIQEMQLKIDKYDDMIFELIPYNQFDYIEKVGKGGFATVYSALWKDGPLKYSFIKNIYKRNNYEEVALKCLDNSQNITKEFLNEVCIYLINLNCLFSTLILFLYLNRLKHIQLKNLIILLKYMEYLKILIQKIILWFFNMQNMEILIIGCIIIMKI